MKSISIASSTKSLFSAWLLIMQKPQPAITRKGMVFELLPPRHPKGDQTERSNFYRDYRGIARSVAPASKTVSAIMALEAGDYLKLPPP